MSVSHPFLLPSRASLPVLCWDSIFFFFFFNTFIDELFPVYLKFVLLLKSQPVLIECLRSRPQPLFSRCALFHAEMITYRHQNRGVSLRCTKMGLLLHGVLPLAFLI